ncbi:GtrA family protein [Nakamurella antarctica]|uniref:GtrA family protein n=2 Tax=Nakamurella antarctica TaxID=1902245 RepID=A0A3G8ZQP9_9ACTN|nr:GtrA family protein [Nakamurella antarctica]
MAGTPGPLLRLIRDQRIAFLLVGGFNTAIGAFFFILFQLILGDSRYLLVLLCAHICAVLCAFVLYRRFVFRVRGHLARDLARFELVNLTSLLINAALLTVAVSALTLPVLPSQLVITAGTMLISFFGHRGFSFRRTATEGKV